MQVGVRRRDWWRAAAVAVCAAVLLVGTAASTGPPDAPPVERHLGAVAFGGEVGELTHLDQYAYVQLNAWETAEATALKAAHPHLRVLVYKDMASVRSYAVRDGRDHDLLPTGVGWVEADTEHPEWFLVDRSGERLEWSYDGHWWMDVGNPDYQQRWAQSVEAELADSPWDGVIIDNVMASPQGYLDGRELAAYPERPRYEAATESFLEAVAPRLRATGALVLGNISDASPEIWDRWTALLSGGNHEHSFAWGDGEVYGGETWLQVVEEIERTQRAGRIHTATSVVGPTDLRALTYVRASWLLAWDGGGSGSAQLVALKDRDDPWHPVTATYLGRPTGPRTLVAGVWRRDFTGGTALVNPDDTTVTVPLEGPLKDLDGSVVTSVTLEPLTGALLKR